MPFPCRSYAGHMLVTCRSHDSLAPTCQYRLNPIHWGHGLSNEEHNIGKISTAEVLLKVVSKFARVLVFLFGSINERAGRSVGTEGQPAALPNGREMRARERRRSATSELSRSDNKASHSNKQQSVLAVFLGTCLTSHTKMGRITVAQHSNTPGGPLPPHTPPTHT